jgi:hypothetical protein
VVAKLTLLLFVLGLVLEIAGFLLGAVEHIPFVLRFVSPDYLAANQGIKALEKGEALREPTSGFEQIASIFINEARSQNSPDIIAKIKVQQFRLAGSSGIAFGRAGVRETVPVTVTLSNGQEVSWELPDIKKKVEELKTSNLFIWGVVLFIAGVLFQIAGFLIEWYEKAPA